MNSVNQFKEKFEQAKQKSKDRNSWQNRYQRLKNTENNKKARKNFQKMLSEVLPEQQLLEEQEAILFTQAYHKLLLKNPAASKFPEFDEYEVEKLESTYLVRGFCDGTNSYGAQVREKYEYEVYKNDNEWTCITDVGAKALKKILIFLLLISLPSIIGYLYISSLY